jgi:2-succinyl-5-enolpyruvyl-6-hydroxy-3-cyclohexene-1-carboxylate synthase
VNTPQINAEVAATLVSAAVLGGVRHVVISPGSRSTPLVMALAAAAEQPRGPTLHVLTDERTAGFFALGLARATRTVVGLLCTSGSAAAHYLPALIEASEDRVPLLVVTADRPAEQQGCGAGQTIDQQRLFGGFVRHFREVGSPGATGAAAYVAGVVARALDEATGTPPGPVHLNVPFREPLWSPEVVAVSARGPLHLERREDAGYDAAQWEPVAEALADRKRPVIVAGPQAWSGSGNLGFHVDLLAGHLGSPLLADATSQLRFLRPRRPDAQRRAPWARQALALVRGDVSEGNAIASVEALLRVPGFTERHRPDAVIRLGRMPSSRTVQTWLGGLPAGETAMVHVDPHGDLHDPTHRADLVVAADPRHILRALSALELTNPLWMARWKEADALAQLALSRACAEGFWEGTIARMLAERVPEGAALHVASSMPIRNLDAFAPTRETELPVFANRGANGIDGTLATALGEAAGREGRVVLFCGDLALLHDVGTLFAAGALGLNVTIVMVDNGGGGIFGFLPIAGQAAPATFERFFRTPPAADFGAIARAAGARHGRITDAAALSDALDAAFEAPGLSLLQCVVDPAHDRDMHTAAWAAVADGLAWLSRTTA